MLVRGDSNQKQQHERNYSGPLLYRQIRDFAAGMITHFDTHTHVNTHTHTHIIAKTESYLTNKASGQEESLEGRLVQRKGRFKVTSADVNAKVILQEKIL